MKKIMIIFCILMLNVITVACQPTPDKAAVIYAGDLEGKIARSSASVAAYDAPGSWRETIDLEGSNAKVTINADICVPDVMAFPVYKVEKTILTDKIVQPLVDYFVRGRDVLKANHTATKSEIEVHMVLAKKAGDDVWYNELKDMYEQAPDKIEKEYVTDWSVGGKNEEITGNVKLENGDYAGITVYQDYFGYGIGDVRTDAAMAVNGNRPVGSVAISEGDAITAAERILDELNLPDMTAYSLLKAQIYSIQSISYFAELSEEPVSKGFTITFVRNIDGIQTRPNESTIFRPSDEFLYTAPLYPEEIRMYVNEQGEVQAFDWLYPLTLTEKISDNVRLMSYTDLQQRIREMFKSIYLYDGEPVCIDRIEMNMTLINTKDSANEALCIPAWYIHCVQKGVTQDLEQTIVINAVDGGRVQVYPNADVAMIDD